MRKISHISYARIIIVEGISAGEKSVGGWHFWLFWLSGASSGSRVRKEAASSIVKISREGRGGGDLAQEKSVGGWHL